MTKREAKIKALTYVITSADINFAHDSQIQDLTESEREKVSEAMDDILDTLARRISRLQESTKATTK